MKAWAMAAGKRMVKTMAQAALGSIGATAIFTEVSWSVVLSTAALAGIISILTSLEGLPEVTE